MTDFNHYIDTDVVGGAGDGTSWANAYSGRDAALDAEAVAIGAGDRVIFNLRGAADHVVASRDLTTLGYTGTGALVMQGEAREAVFGASAYTMTAALYQDINNAGAAALELLGIQYVASRDNNQRVINSESGAVGPDLLIDGGFYRYDGNGSGIQSLVYYEGVYSDAITITIRNAVLKNWNDVVAANYYSGATILIENCVIVGNAIANDLHPDATVTIRNCALVGVTLFNTAEIIYEHCAYDSSESAPSADSIAIADWSAQFVDAANDDYTLAPSSALLAAGSTGNNIGADQTTVVANQDPSKDSDSPDTLIDTNGSGSYDHAADFSDPDSDPLTFSVNPALPAGMSMTNAGLRSWSGMTAGAPTLHDIIATDGNGGTDAVDRIVVGVAPDGTTWITDTVAAKTGIYAEAEFAGVAVNDVAYAYWETGSGVFDATNGAVQSDDGGVLKIWFHDVSDPDIATALNATPFTVNVPAPIVTVDIGQIPLTIQVGWNKTDLVDPVTTEGSVLEGYSGDAPVTGDDLEWRVTSTLDSGVTFDVLATGEFEVTEATAGDWVTDIVVERRVVQSDGTIGSTANFTAEASTEISGLSFNCYDADNLNTVITNETLSHVRVLNPSNLSEVATVTNIVTSSTGSAVIDTNSVTIGTDYLVIARRSNGDVCEPFTVTATDLAVL